MITLPCNCQYQVHKLNYDRNMEDYIMSMIKEKGAYKRILLADNSTAYKVPIAFILVHGLAGYQLTSYGFPEWKDGDEQDTSGVIYEPQEPKGGEQNGATKNT